MENIFAYILVGILVIFGGLIALYYGINYLVASSLKPIQQIIATNISVTSQWVEIIPESPMKVNKQMIQRLFLIIDGYEFDESNDNWQLKISDGTIVEPEIQILDEYGKVYDLHNGTRIGNLVGFYPKRNGDRFNGFPADRTYTKIRIRSNEPFLCSKIIWSNKRLK